MKREKRLKGPLLGLWGNLRGLGQHRGGGRAFCWLIVPRGAPGTVLCEARGGGGAQRPGGEGTPPDARIHTLNSRPTFGLHSSSFNSQRMLENFSRHANY